MKGIEKYDNLKEIIPKLQPVLIEAIQTEFLEIKKVDKKCEKFIAMAEKYPELHQAEYVIFSQHLKKKEHKNEMFVFIDEMGNVVCHISGWEMELYGLIESCSELHISDDYVETQKFCTGDECRH